RPRQRSASAGTGPASGRQTGSPAQCCCAVPGESAEARTNADGKVRTWEAPIEEKLRVIVSSWPLKNLNSPADHPASILLPIRIGFPGGSGRMRVRSRGRRTHEQISHEAH